MKTRAKNAILGRLRAATAAGFPRVSAPTIPRKPGGGVADFERFAAVLTTLGPTFELARTPEEALSAFFRPEPQKSPSFHRKPPGIALISFACMHSHARK